MKNKVVVLGAGIAGLTASINLLQKGYDVTLVEKNDDVGGLCSGYFVNGHYIDACIHWLMGTNKDSGLYSEWQNIGAINEDTNIISLPTLGSFEYKGTTVTFYRDLEKTEQELVKISAEDEKAIHKFISSVRDMGSIMGAVLKNKNITTDDILHSLSNFAHIIKSMRESRETYSLRFKHPAIRFAIKHAQTGYNNMFFFLDLYGLFASGNADVPEGGAYYMVQRIKSKFLELGGKLLVNTPIKELKIKKYEVFAAKTEDITIRGDYFISTIDPQYTLTHLLKNKYRIKAFEKLEKNIDNNPITSCLNVYLAVKKDISYIDVPTTIRIKPVKVGVGKIDFLLIRPYHFDKHFIHEGKTVVNLFVDQNQDDYNYYKSLDEKAYKRTMKRIIKSLVTAFVTRYPELEDKVEVLSAFSPIEINKRTNTSYGSIQSYSFTDKKLLYAYDGEIKGLDNFYLCGQWNRSMGGTPTALLTAIDICKNFEEIKPEEKKRKLSFFKKKEKVE